MINFDALTLKLFLDENKEFFLGARIQKIQQPSRNELIFFIRNMAETKKFYINFNPNFYHLCFMSEVNAKRRHISIPKTAPMFCMLLRKYIQNSKIINVEVPKNERIFEIYFEYYDELNEKTQLCLAIELMGKYSNVILYNYDTNVIVGCAHNVSSEKSRERELSGLMPYVYPKKQNRKNLLRVTFESFSENIDNNNIIESVATKYNYLTMSMVEIFYNNIQPFSVQKFYNKLCDFLSQKSYQYYILNDFSKFVLFDCENSFKCEDVNSMIDEYFSYNQNEIIEENLKQKLLKNINTRLKKLYTLQSKQKEQIEKLDKAVEYKNKGDILMANLYSVKDFEHKVNLYDFDGKETQIELDVNLTLTQNANRYYSLYKKAKSSFEHANLMIENTNSEIMFMEEQKFYVENTDDIENLNEINALIFNEQEKTAKEKDFKVDYVDYKGFRIYIGKNQKQNDYILSKLSTGEDLWFHPLNSAGSHVLVKSVNNEEIPDDVLLKAAQITKEYSSQKDNSKTSIIYTKRKYVKKATNKIAFVTYKNESEIVV